MDQPIAVVCADDALAEEVVRLALVAGSSARRCADLAGVPASARLVVAGCAELPERPLDRPLLAVAWRVDLEAARRALEAGAAGLRRLPDDEGRLVEELRRAGEPQARGALRVVVGASGGAGASTVAAAVALEAPEPALLVDLDPLGGALELALGLERAPGPRWSALVAGEGRLAPTALREALPRYEQVAVLANDGLEVEPQALERVLVAARAVGPVVVDLPRQALAADGWAGADVVIVARGDLPSAVATRRLVERVRRLGGSARLLVRRGGLPTATVASVAGLPAGRPLPEERRLVRLAGRGLACPPPAGVRRVARAAAW